ncbi:unnamed protein product [Nyctereutes procyonoides]|uniref:(raccoon dog) hypothetical protein n=1 Tax=Nyctereutes procyonoides TaxID=34880 RepID=A0A811ZE54_NYCPR|nr:unnamed protein product [Nyctereutes procyonoides]
MKKKKSLYHYYNTYSSVALSTFALLCSYHNHPFPEHFHLIKLKLHPSNTKFSFLSYPQPQATTILLLCQLSFISSSCR